MIYHIRILKPSFLTPTVQANCKVWSIKRVPILKTSYEYPQLKRAFWNVVMKQCSSYRSYVYHNVVQYIKTLYSCRITSSWIFSIIWKERFKKFTLATDFHMLYWVCALCTLLLESWCDMLGSNSFSLPLLDRTFMFVNGLYYKLSAIYDGFICCKALYINRQPFIFYSCFYWQAVQINAYCSNIHIFIYAQNKCVTFYIHFVASQYWCELKSIYFLIPFILKGIWSQWQFSVWLWT